ncbi:MAG: hypothetical protein ABIA93_01610 [Candidatus Woesearchaeota archaeon]
MVAKRENLTLFVREGESLKAGVVPRYVVRDLLRDRLGEDEIARIHRFIKPVESSTVFQAGSVVVDFSKKQAECFDARIDVKYLEPTWDVKINNVTLANY